MRHTYGVKMLVQLSSVHFVVAFWVHQELHVWVEVARGLAYRTHSLLIAWFRSCFGGAAAVAHPVVGEGRDFQVMADPLLAYQGLMRENLLALQHKVAELEARDRALGSGVEALRRRTGKRCIVSLSLGWLVETDQTEATEIVGRMQQRNSRELDGAKMKLADCEAKVETLTSLVSASSDHLTNEDGLPMMEIREAVDEEGNEISSKVIAASEMSKVASTFENLLVLDSSPAKEGQETSQEEQTRKTNLPVAAEPSPPPVLIEDKSADDLDEFDEFEEMPLTAAPQTLADTLQSLVEMENIVGEFELDEIEEFDEFEDEDDFEVATDEEEDEDEFGRTRGNLVPVDLLQRYSHLNGGKQREAVAKDKKEVRFSDTLEIQHPPSQPPTQQVLERRAVDDIRPRQAAPTSTGVMSEEIVERGVQSSGDEPMAPDDIDQVIHRQEVATEYHQLRTKFIQQQGGYIRTDEDKATEPIEEPAKKVSRFKAARLAFKEA